ncbi:MAG: SLBB domain-containing protein [Spirochaetales bacterium]|nr:SLBB domain-containing protein [Spirochaetales bacterium]
MPGFGNQPINVEKELSTKAQIQKILGNIPYKLTPGDTYQIVIKLDESFSQTLVLDENYKLEIPFIGTMQVKGMFFSELRQKIVQRIKAERIVDFVDFILVAPAIFEVFIYGGVKQPGIISVTPINTLWEAIVLANGFKQGGSYRQIKLIRDKMEFVFDLRKYIQEGDIEQNPRLEPGDRIYVPHASIIVKIEGDVLYPDNFELLPGESLFDLIQMAGGYLPYADRSSVEVNHIGEDGYLQIEYINETEASRFGMQNGDIVLVKSTLENKEMILIEGALHGKPTTGTEPAKIPDKLLVFNMPYIKGITLLQVLDKYGGPTILADLENSSIIREKTGENIKVDIKTLWDTRNPELDIRLEPSDHIVIPMKQTMVIVAGQVNSPGTFPFQSNRVVSEYILLAGGIDSLKGDPNGIYFIDRLGKRARATLGSEVLPGSLIYVDRNALEKTTYTIGKFSIIAVFIATIAAATVDIVSVFNSLNN